MRNIVAYRPLAINYEALPPFANTKSLLFDGINDYIDLSTSTGLSFSNDFTLSAWVKTSAIGANQYIIDASTSFSLGHGYSLRLLTTGAVRFWSFKAGSLIDSTTTLLSNTWYHIAATHDITGLENKIYINGVLDVSGAPGQLTATPTTNLRIGTSALLGGPFNGNIDEVSFFNRVVTPAEIVTLSTAPAVDLTSLNPIAWYRNGDNGSYKSPQWLIPNNENKDKVSNYSMDFDGLDAYITCGDLNTLVANKSKLSISFWVNLADATEVNRITGKISDPASTSKWLGVSGTTTNGLTFVVSGGSFAYVETSNVLTSNTWHNVVCVFDGTQGINADRAKIYVDNVEVALSYNGTLPTLTYDFASEAITTPWYVGQAGLQFGVNELRGMLDEYAIYSDVALTSLEVSEIYNSGVPNDLSTLSVTPDLWYKMGEEATFSGGVWTVGDEVGTNDGSSVNMDIFDRIGEAPNSENNALSLNMDFVDVVPDVP